MAEFQVKRLGEVAIARRGHITSKIDRLYQAAMALKEGECVVVDVPEGYSMFHFRENTRRQLNYRLKRNGLPMGAFCFIQTEGGKSVVITKKTDEHSS